MDLPLIELMFPVASATAPAAATAHWQQQFWQRQRHSQVSAIISLSGLIPKTADKLSISRGG